MNIIDADSVFGAWPKKHVDISLGALLDHMGENGIARSVVLSAKGIFYSHDEGNAETLAVCAKHKELVPAATINPRGIEPGMRLPARLKREGFRLLRFFPDHQGWPVEYLPFLDLLDGIEDAGLPLMFPCGGLGTATALLKAVGKRKIQVLMVNTGYAQLAEVLHVMKANRNFCVTTKLHNSPDGLEILAKHAGAGRLVFGSGQPMDFIQNSLEVIRQSGLQAADKERILGKNLLKLLKGH